MSGQVVFDGSLEPFGGAGAGGAAEGLAGQYDIGVADGVTRGGNLFHRFSQFDLGSGESAIFGSAHHERIIASVSSGEASQIDGLIRVRETDGGASGTDLYLVNPAGIIMGPGARIEVGGDFFATTAERIRLGEGAGAVDYYATGMEGLSFSAAAPESFGFLSGGGAGELEVEGALEFLEGDVHLSGGSVSVRESVIYAEGNELTVVAMGEAGGEWPLAGGGQAGGRVSLDNLVYFDDSVAGGGEVAIVGGTIEMSGGSLISVANSAQGGSIRLDASDSIHLREGARIQSAGLVGAGGEVEILAGGELSLESGARILGGTFSAGDGGELRISAGAVRLDGRDGQARISAQANSGSSGDAGRIFLDVGGRLELLNGAAILGNTNASGRAADIVISAGELLMDRGSGAGGEFFGPTEIASASIRSEGFAGTMGEAGRLDIRVGGQARILNNARIAATTSSERAGGWLDFSAGSLLIRGPEVAYEELDPQRNWFLTGLVGITDWKTPGLMGGRGGDLQVSVAGEIWLERGGLIDSSSFGSGPGGDVSVSAARVFVDGQGSPFFTGIGSDTEAFPGRIGSDGEPLGIDGGPAGDVGVRADGIELRGGGLISASSTGSGKGGDILVDTGELRIVGSGEGEAAYVPVRNSGVVAVGRGSGDSGTVRILGRLVELAEGGAVLSRNSGGGVAGDIVIEVERLVLADGALIEGATAGSGDGGNIGISAREGVELRDSLLSASSGGDGGGVEIETTGRVWTVGSEILAEAGGTGGNITLKADELILNGTLVSANALEGRGGVIDFTTGTYLAGDSTVTATGGGGDGEIVINAEAVLQGGEENEEVEPLDATDELQEECTKRLATKAGSFIMAGKGGTKRLPGGYLPSMTIVE